MVMVIQLKWDKKYRGWLKVDFNEFYENVEKMKYDLQEQFINADEVKIEYTKFDGNNCLWAILDDKVVSYFKW